MRAHTHIQMNSAHVITEQGTIGGFPKKQTRSLPSERTIIAQAARSTYFTDVTSSYGLVLSSARAPVGEYTDDSLGARDRERSLA